LARLLGRYALPLQQEREPQSEDGSTSSVARLGIVSTYASLQAANGVDLYKALGISSQASPLEIKVAFRQLAKALHPDRNAGDKLAEQQFAAVREAYSILANAEWRAIYDRELELIRAAAAAQEARRIATRRRLFVGEAFKTVAATVILTAIFIIGLSVWQQSSNGLQRTRTAEADAAPPRAQIRATITSAELADALFGSQASRYSNGSATASSEATAASNPPQPQGEAVPAGSEPPSGAVAENSEPSASGSEIIVSQTSSAPGDEPPATAVAAAAADPALALAEVPIATAPELPTREAALPAPPPAIASLPTKPPDPATRAQAERLVRQGDRQFANGNVAIARQYYARAADLGFAPAAAKLADTFDAKVLARHGVHGVRPNPAEAEKWRKRAAELAQ
jgi:curved DNA-binding protein CbpA